MRRRTVWIAVAAAAVLALGGGAVFAIARSAPSTEPTSRPRAAEAVIERGTLSGSVKATGSLKFADPHDIGSTITGVLTSAPRPGATVGVGKPLFLVDNVPVFLFRGTIPAWRPFASGMGDGPDVQQLEENLAALGFFKEQPDRKFRWATTEAIRAWQKATGQERTGGIDLGRIVFDRGELRVQDVKVQLGGSVGGGAAILSVTTLQKHVNVKLPLTSQQLAKVGGAVQITLPEGTRTTGKVTSVETPQQESDGSVSIPVLVALDDPAAAGDLQQANVTVGFPSEVRENVLSVPVAALIALDDERFGVEVVDEKGSTRRVPVTRGIFAGGRVEISGDGLEAGQKVVVPKV
ncbi:efflux RND transporter periplasmic adaptor subunit [Dactylosporangium fulvum]|uniref:Peptidoglycan-binding protein n=1 Tax=Dactylosporangium fulvum TaxID=53359 RepID=A0ABY5VX85_9ACTN|nr:peptidoglycan-binding protein [Dactylosporangium fulvum]UWP82403.1 peptidoglycan-binding protein [Dactylosporangium fulvum]